MSLFLSKSPTHLISFTGLFSCTIVPFHLPSACLSAGSCSILIILSFLLFLVCLVPYLVLHYLPSRINLFPTTYFINLGFVLKKCYLLPSQIFCICTSYLGCIYPLQQKILIWMCVWSYSFMEKLSNFIIRVHVYIVMELLHVISLLT